ncbi:MAG: hypothetical protein QXT81_06570 [Candidatus Bathyarchaeia archaeon]
MTTMSRLKLNVRAAFAAALIVTVTLGVVEPASAAYNGEIIPPSPYSVYTNQVYSLTISFHYMAATPCAFWIESPPYQSGKQTLKGSGTSAVALTLQAPSTPGIYTLGLKLYIQPEGQTPTPVDTATVTYEVIEPIKTDWDVEKVWIDPASPLEGDQVTFHARITLRSTNSKQPLTVTVACVLDNKIYSSGSLTFSPQPSYQDITAKPWTATKGAHTLVFVVDPNREHNDPTPYPQYNYKELRFNVETYYAVIERINPVPSEVDEGEWFEAVIVVAYRFPASATIEIHHDNNATMPPVSDSTRDTVTGSGSKEYRFRARAPYTRPTNASEETWILQGSGWVQFDRGAGWEKTDPGWRSLYNVTVRRLRYYAIFDSVTAEYTGTTGGGTNASIGHVQVSLRVRYLVPLESGLRLIVSRSGGTAEGGQVYMNRTSPWGWVIWSDESEFTQDEPVERTGTYAFEYTFPSGSAEGTINLHATVHYLAYGEWRYGDGESVGASVPSTPREPERSPSAFDYISAAFNRILDWFKSLFGIGR